MCHHARVAGVDEWRKRAREDALFAVASHSGKEGGRWDPEEFAALGRSDWADFRQQWEQYLAGPVGGEVLEIGYGAGRITASLADAFSRVVGVDVSEDMRDLATKAAPTADLRLVDGPRLPLPDADVDAVFTCHVWQHYEARADLRRQVHECLRVLRPGGSLMAHVILQESRAQPLVEAKGELARRIGALVRPATSHTTVRSYLPAEVRGMLERAGFTDVQLREFRVRSNDGVHPCFFARRAAS